ARVAEAAEVADLGEKAERGQAGDAAEAAEPGHRVTPGGTARDLLELAVECGDLRVESGQVQAHLLQRRLRVSVLEPLPRHPGSVFERPAPLPLAEDAAVTQELLGHPVAGGSAGDTEVVPAAQQIAQPLLLAARR